MSSLLKHVFEENGLCLTCGKVCEHCNQCKCEINRVRTCPGFNTKRFPDQFEKWKADRAESRLQDREFFVTRAAGPGSESYERQKRLKSTRIDWSPKRWEGWVAWMTRKHGPGSPGYVNYPGGKWPEHLTNRRRSARMDGDGENATQ